MKTVRDILKVKGQAVWCVEMGSTVFEALGRMAEKIVLVLDGDEAGGSPASSPSETTLERLSFLAEPPRTLGSRK